MASFDYNVLITYSAPAGDWAFSTTFSYTGTITDQTTDGTFSAGEDLYVANIASGNFIGTAVVDGRTYVVKQSASYYELFTRVDPVSSFSGTNAFFDAPTFSSLTLDHTDVNDPFAVCFAAGTPIATPGGERAVETLAIGDPILTADGRTVPVKWIGRQTLHKFVCPAERFAPVRIAAGAFGEAVPHVDLVVTSDHGMILDGMVVNAGALVNGTTITVVAPFELPDQVTYYHIETENHETILAAGAPTETFVDYVGRRAFDNHAEYTALYGAETLIAEMDRPRISSARQLTPELRARFGIPVETIVFPELEAA